MQSIVADHLTKRFGQVVAVDYVSFTVEPGKVTSFLGTNGAGKTTTLRMLLGLVKPTHGTATIGGRPYGELKEPLRQVGALLESAGFHPGRTARNHLRLQAVAAGLSVDRVETVLDIVKLTSSADRHVGGFSLGMRQRLGLASALLGDPQILILDEPANGLDPEGVRWFRNLLRRLTGEGRSVLMSSHILAEVSQTSDNVIILDRGRLIAEAPLSQLMAAADVGHASFRIRTSKAQELRKAVVKEGADARVTEGGWVKISGSTQERVATIATELRIPVFESVAEADNLEDVFFRLTASGKVNVDKK